jgi:hypothetical protein
MTLTNTFMGSVSGLLAMVQVIVDFSAQVAGSVNTRLNT